MECWEAMKKKKESEWSKNRHFLVPFFELEKGQEEWNEWKLANDAASDNIIDKCLPEKQWWDGFLWLDAFECLIDPVKVGSK